MDKKVLSYIFKGVGIVLGLISVVTLITRHPILIGLSLLGGVVYMVGEYIKRV